MTDDGSTPHGTVEGGVLDQTTFGPFTVRQLLLPAAIAIASVPLVAWSAQPLHWRWANLMAVLPAVVGVTAVYLLRVSQRWAPPALTILAACSALGSEGFVLTVRAATRAPKSTVEPALLVIATITAFAVALDAQRSVTRSLRQRRLWRSLATTIRDWQDEKDDVDTTALRIDNDVLPADERLVESVLSWSLNSPWIGNVLVGVLVMGRYDFPDLVPQLRMVRSKLDDSDPWLAAQVAADEQHTVEPTREWLLELIDQALEPGDEGEPGDATPSTSP